jgi:hypothetical protein
MSAEKAEIGVAVVGFGLAGQVFHRRSSARFLG